MPVIPPLGRLKQEDMSLRTVRATKQEDTVPKKRRRERKRREDQEF
jgi:hypothetical protein